MKAENVYNQFLKVAKYLLKELDYYGANQFKQKVENQEWTIGEYYDFLINSTLNYYIPNVNKALKANDGNSEGKKKFKGKLLFWYGRVPAIVKYQDTSDYKPVQPEGTEKVKDTFYRFIKIMNKAAQEIDSAGASQSKIEHPTLGMLSALEWYRLIEINFKHHLRIKYEMDKVIRSSYPNDPDDDLPDFQEEVREVREEDY
jgi:hypothetical protein